MSLRVETVTVDAHDAEALARWWAELLGSTAEADDEDWVVDAGASRCCSATTPMTRS